MKLIKKQNRFILVSDEDLKKGDLFIGTDLIIGRASKDLDVSGRRKIIALVELLPEVDFSVLRKKDLLRIIQSLQQTSWYLEVNENNQVIKILK